MTAKVTMNELREASMRVYGMGQRVEEGSSDVKIIIGGRGTITFVGGSRPKSRLLALETLLRLAGERECVAQT